MSKDDTQHMIAPQLRFPEFVNESLCEVQLDEVTEECTTRNGDMLPPESVMGVRKGGGIVPMEERLIGTDISRYKLVRRNWFAYNPMRLNIGSIARWSGDNDILVSPDYVVFRCLEDADKGIDSTYLDHFRESDHWEDFVAESGIGSVRVRIYYKDIGRLRLRLPTLPEQRKIAACLGSLDELIATEGRKLATLREHKKGLMQQLFPREGETRPRLRFPEFRNAPEWESKQLGPMTTKIGSGITPRGGSKNYKEAGRAFIRSQNVGWGNLVLDEVAHIDEETHASFDGTEIKKNDVLLNISGASIGRCAVADERIVGGNVNQHVCIVRTDRDSMHPILLSQFLVSQRGQKQIDQCQAGGNRQGLNFGQIRSFMVPVPPLVAEQQRIADCLYSLDALIATQTEKLDALRTHKRGLIQQLFPSPTPEGAGI